MLVAADSAAKTVPAALSVPLELALTQPAESVAPSSVWPLQSSSDPLQVSPDGRTCPAHAARAGTSAMEDRSPGSSRS